ncbi:MAG: protein-L-isoaspartate(D-aspartate) O-methyltransferase [Owenweeksia sp.]
MTIDQHRHKGQRNKLIRTLIQKGVRDEEVLKAIYKVPRHTFMDSSFEAFAYQDKAFPIAAGQTISQPYTVAFQTMLLQVEKGHKVLEIGTGSGYQAAVLCELGVKLYTIERQKELFSQTRILMNKLKYNLHMKFGDGFAGMPTYAPFDRIIVTAGAPGIPPALVEQLKVGGRMVIPVGDDTQQMKLVIKTSPGEIQTEDHGDFRFVPMLRNRNS